MVELLAATDGDTSPAPLELLGGPAIRTIIATNEARFLLSVQELPLKHLLGLVKSLNYRREMF